MKSTISIVIQDLDTGELQRVLQALHGGTVALAVIGTVEETVPAPAASDAPAKPAADPLDAPPPPAASDASAPAGEETPAPASEPPKAAKRGRPRKNPSPDAGEEVGEATPAATSAASVAKVTYNAVKQAIAAGIKSKGIEAVRKVVASFQNAQGAPASKLSDLQEKDYGAVVAALEAPAEA